MIELEPEDMEEVKRVALRYVQAFRDADPDTAEEMTVLPIVDCVDLGSRCGVYLMNETDFRHSVEAHKGEDFETEVVAIAIEPLGKNAAIARIEAELLRDNGQKGDAHWVEFLARTDEGWKVWATWLGPAPEGF